MERGNAVQTEPFRGEKIELGNPLWGKRVQVHRVMRPELDGLYFHSCGDSHKPNVCY